MVTEQDIDKLIDTIKNAVGEVQGDVLSRGITTTNDLIEFGTQPQGYFDTPDIVPKKKATITDEDLVKSLQAIKQGVDNILADFSSGL